MSSKEVRNIVQGFKGKGSTLPLWLFGSKGYGQLQGKVMAARLTVSATAPFALALMMGRVGVSWSLVITATIGGLQSWPSSPSAG